MDVPILPSTAIAMTFEAKGNGPQNPPTANGWDTEYNSASTIGQNAASVGAATSAQFHAASARRIHHSRAHQRRRCRSECLRMAPSLLRSAGHRQSASFNSADLRQKSTGVVRKSDICPGVVPNSIPHSTNGRKSFSIVNTRQFNSALTLAALAQGETKKENITSEDLFDMAAVLCDEDADELADLKAYDLDKFHYSNFELQTDKTLLKNQQYLLRLNEEIDRKYSDILAAARNDSKGVYLPQSMTIVGLTKQNVAKDRPMHGMLNGQHKRRARARSDSEPRDIYRLSPISPTLIKSAGDDLLSKRSRDCRSTKSIRPATAAVTTSSTINTVLQGKSLHSTPPAPSTTTKSATNYNSNRKLVPNQTGNSHQQHHHRLLAAARNHHHPSKQLNVLKTVRQKALLKAKKQHQQHQKEQQSKGSIQSIKSPLSPMVISIPIEGSTPTAPSPVATSKINGNNGELANATATENYESEYSSLEDDDDFAADVAEGDANDSLSETEEANSASLTNGAAAPADPSQLPNVTMIADCVSGRRSLPGPLTSSMFPHVPPYITFSSHEEKGPQMPPEITKVLKWKLTTITPLVIRRILINSGFRLLKKTNDWMGVWGKHMKSPCFKTVRSHQKMNHLPGSFQIGRKDRVWRNLQTKMLRHGKKEFNFMPRTYIIPHDMKLLKRAWPRYNQANTKWIIKPPASARGVGIKVINKWSQIPKRKSLIVQKYVDRPLLINGSKFDLRLYVLVTSINPLRVYMHTDGLARFASVKYSEKCDTLSDRFMHLTNYSINKLSANYASNEDATACQGHKWTVKSLWTYLAGQGVNTQRLWGALRNLVLRTIFAGEHAIHQMSKANVGSKYNCFELFGIDVILDSELKPWLLEVNISPSLHSASPLDLYVKGPLVTALLNTVLYHVPPKLSATEQENILANLGLTGNTLCYDKRLHVTNLTKAERIKHNQFSQRSMAREDYLDAILENLTPDDIRCLITTEDELNRCAPLERILPTPTSHRYLNYTENPRYYNRLLDAWEARFASKRDDGIALLRKYCDNKVHLIVPPQTTKKDLENNDDDSNPNSDDELEEMATNSHNNDVEIKNASDSGDSVPEIGDLDDGINVFRTTTVANTASTEAGGRSVQTASVIMDATRGKLLSPQKLGTNSLANNSDSVSVLQQVSSMLTNQTSITSTLPIILQGEEPITEDRTDEMMKSSPSKLSLMNNHHSNIQSGYLTGPSN